MGIKNQNQMLWVSCEALNKKKDCHNPAHRLHRHSWLGGWYWSNGIVILPKQEKGKTYKKGWRIS